MDFGSRLSAAMFAAGFTTNKLLIKKVSGITEKEVRDWRKNKQIPGAMLAKTLIDLSVSLNVRAFWLAEGQGPIHRFTAAEYSEKELVSAFCTLPKRHKAMVRDMIGLIMRSNESG